MHHAEYGHWHEYCHEAIIDLTLLKATMRNENINYRIIDNVHFKQISYNIQGSA